MNEREKARLFNLAVINAMLVIFAGFLHMLLLSPQSGAVAALAPALKEASEKKAAAAKEAAEFRRAKLNFKNEVEDLKRHFRKNFAEKDIERIQGELSAMADGMSDIFYNMEFSLKKIYFVEVLEVKASFKNARPADFLDFIDRARARFYLAPLALAVNSIGAASADISFDFYIPFNAFRVRSLIEGNL